MNSIYKRHKGNLFVISGPSAVGKGTICKELVKRYNDIVYSVSATTRKPRTGEIHGREYFFYSKDEFLNMIDNNTFLEWAKVYENYYGTPESFVEEVTSSGKDCILEIDVQGALQVKKKKPDGVFIFVVPPSKEELISRINGRGTEDENEITKRMQSVDAELALIKNYDYVIVNDDLGNAVEMIRCIFLAERARVKNYL